LVFYLFIRNIISTREIHKRKSEKSSDFPTRFFPFVVRVFVGLLTHVQTSGTDAETETGRTEVLTIATFAVDLSAVVADSGGIHLLLAVLTAEALDVEVHSSRSASLSFVHASAAAGAPALHGGNSGTSGGSGAVGHLTFGVTELRTRVHGESTSTTTESVALGSEFAAVALFAEDVSIVLGQGRTVQHLRAHTAFQAHLMPFPVGGQLLLSLVDWLATFRAFVENCRLEWHDHTGTHSRRRSI